MHSQAQTRRRARQERDERCHVFRVRVAQVSGIDLARNDVIRDLAAASLPCNDKAYACVCEPDPENAGEFV